MELEERIRIFRQDLVKLDEDALFKKYFLKGNTYLFETLLKSNQLEKEFKKTIAQAFNTSPNNIYLVGSSKIGFSISPLKLFNPIDYKFKTTKKVADQSDLDVAIVDIKLFSRIGREVYNFTKGYNNKWEWNEYYKGKEKNTPNEIILCYKYFEYFTKGWFKIEYKPNAYDMCAPDWNLTKLLSELRKITNRKVNFAVYSGLFYFKGYHIANLAN